MNILQQDSSADPRSEHLAAGRVLRLDRGGRLDVVAGCVWLTASGDGSDRIVAAGQSIDVAETQSALIESWGADAVVSWRASATPSCGGGRSGLVSRCWELMHPLARLGLGSAAAVTALLVGALVFGPLSQARAQALAGESSLHNPPQVGPVPDVETMRHVDRSRPAFRARLAAQEARRRAPGAA